MSDIVISRIYLCVIHRRITDEPLGELMLIMPRGNAIETISFQYVKHWNPGAGAIVVQLCSIEVNRIQAETGRTL